MNNYWFLITEKVICLTYTQQVMIGPPYSCDSRPAECVLLSFTLIFSKSTGMTRVHSFLVLAINKLCWWMHAVKQHQKVLVLQQINTKSKRSREPCPHLHMQQHRIRCKTVVISILNVQTY